MSEQYGKYKIVYKFGNKENGKAQFGSGANADVFLAENEEEKDQKKMYIVKTIELKLEDKKKGKAPKEIIALMKKAFNKEIDILKNLPNNKYIPYIYDSKKYIINEEENISKKLNGKSKSEVNNDNENGYYVIDFFSNGNLFYYLKTKLSEKRYTKLLFKKIVEIIQFLHTNNICHLDIKPDNFLLDKDFEPIIIDFGHSEKIKESNGEIQTFHEKKCARFYECPQMWEKDIKYTGVETDIFCLGVVLYNIVTGEFGFGSWMEKYINYNWIKDKKYGQYWEKVKHENLSEDFKNLYVKMVAFNPLERPSIQEILNDNWLKEVSNLESEENDKLEEEYREELAKIYENIRSDEKIQISEEIRKHYNTKYIEEENRIFCDVNLKPKKIFNENIYINQYIKINGYFPEGEVDFMNSLSQKIEDNLNGDCRAFEEILKFEVTFDRTEEIGKCKMEIELFESEKGRYLLEFVRKKGEIQDYYHYFSEIKKIIIKILG